MLPHVLAPPLHSKIIVVSMPGLPGKLLCLRQEAAADHAGNAYQTGSEKTSVPAQELEESVGLPPVMAKPVLAQPSLPTTQMWSPMPLPV
jgi:hypothetical protein